MHAEGVVVQPATRRYSNMVRWCSILLLPTVMTAQNFFTFMP